LMRHHSTSDRALGVRLFRLFWLLPVLLVAPVGAWAQGDAGCDVPRHEGMVMTTLSNETRMFFFFSPTIRCPGGVQISADSARVYESTNYNRLWGNVVFWDEDSRLTADEAQYFSAQRRLVAQYNAVLEDLTEGSVITGELMTLIRAGPDQPEDDLTVSGGSPHATLYPTRQPEPEVVLPDSVGEEGEALPPDSAIVPPDSVLLAREEPPAPTLPVLGGAMPDMRLETEAERVPYEIDAQRFVLEGTRFFRATGRVVVNRDSLTALADSLEYDQDVAALFLSGNARVTTAQTDLAADAIRLEIPQDEVREAVATGEAVLDGEDLRLLAPIVYLFFTEGRLERLMARRDAVADSIAAEIGEQVEDEEVPRRRTQHPVAIELGLEEFPFRPYALAQDFILEGDSIEVKAPGEVLDEVWAMGNARGESMIQDSLTTPDTPPLIARDWLEGDTIVAFFGEKSDSLLATDQPLLERHPDAVDTPADQADYRLEQLVARVSARSMYRMAPSDSTLAAEGERLAIHYVIGDEITILLNEDGEAERMEVIGQTRGIHLEPLPGKGEPVDTVAVPDTSGISRGGQRPGPARSGLGLVLTGGGSGG